MIHAHKHIVGVGWLVGVVVLLMAGCDTVEPTEEAQLVVEAFLDADKPLPAVTLRQSRPMARPYPGDSATAATDATVRLRLGERVIAYQSAVGHPGRYVPPPPARSTTVPPRDSFALYVEWREQQARAEGRVPPPIALDSVRVRVPEAPVEAVLLDSLRLDTLNTDARQGFIYPVEVTLWWKSELGAADSLYWVRPQLQPSASFSSTAVDFFLRRGELLREQTLLRDAQVRRHWTGVYAVPVEEHDDAIPVHWLRVALLRGTSAYARFAATREAPERREPVSNVEGALGIVAGLSVDSVRVRVE